MSDQTAPSEAEIAAACDVLDADDLHDRQKVRAALIAAARVRETKAD